jgi:hypothetical protein
MLLFTLGAVATLVQVSEAVQCYNCVSGSVGCDSGAKFNPQGSGVILVNCTATCSKTTATVAGLTSYVRTCGTGSVGSVCAAGVCIDTCGTDFCNHAPSPAPYTTLSLLSSLLVLPLAKLFS